MDFGGGRPADQLVDPQGPEQSRPPLPPDCHLFRGGYFFALPNNCRSAIMAGTFLGGAEYAGTFVGFRLVVELPAADEILSSKPQ